MWGLYENEPDLQMFCGWLTIDMNKSKGNVQESYINSLMDGIRISNLQGNLMDQLFDNLLKALFWDKGVNIGIFNCSLN